MVCLSPLGPLLSSTGNAVRQACSIGCLVCSFIHSLIQSFILLARIYSVHPLCLALCQCWRCPSEGDGHGPCPQGASGQVYKQSQPSVKATVRGKESARRSPVETDTRVPPWARGIEAQTQPKLWDLNPRGWDLNPAKTLLGT